MNLNNIGKCIFINLDRRQDRLDHINKTLPFNAKRFSAIDAKKVKLNSEIKKLFPKTWKDRTKAEICCALSHYKVWLELLNDKECDNYLILEDDVVFNDGFTQKWNHVFSKNIPTNYNLIYLGGCQPWNKPHYGGILKKYNKYFSNVIKNNFFTKNDYFWHMNASSYILSKQGASLLCQWIIQQGIDDAIDNFMQKFFNSNQLFTANDSIFHLSPLMAYQLHEEGDNIEIDKNSDLRFATDKFQEDITDFNLIWQVDPNSPEKCYETDWIRYLFSEINHKEIIDCKFNKIKDNSIIIYNDIFDKNEDNNYTQRLYKYLDKACNYNNVSIMHLGDEFVRAKTDHYKKFKTVIRTTFNKKVANLSNIIQIPLGYKQGFHD